MKIDKDLYIKEVATLSGLSEATLKKLYRINMLILSHELNAQEQLEEGTKKYVNLGTYGQLEITEINNRLVYRFHASAEFNKVVRRSILEKQNLLTNRLSDKLIKHIEKTYRDII